MTCISLKHYLQQTQRHCSDGSHVKTRDGQQQQGEESGSHVRVHPLKNPGELNFMGILVIRLMRKKLNCGMIQLCGFIPCSPTPSFRSLILIHRELCHTHLLQRIVVNANKTIS